MEDQNSSSLRILRGLTRAALACITLIAAQANSQGTGPTGPTPPPYSVVPAVAPVSAIPGVERTFTVSGLWPSGCSPQSITVLSNFEKYTRTLVLRLELPPSGTPCTLAQTTYTLTAKYTPDSEGTTRVLAISSEGVYLGEVNMITDLPNAVRARYDLNGNWYDPNTNGSGLAFAHAFTGSDAVFGTWYLYDAQGLPRWFSIQAGRWTSNTQYTAQLWETRSSTNPCQLPIAVCPVRVTTAVTTGSVIINVLSKDTAKVEARDLAGNRLFASDVIRMAL